VHDLPPETAARLPRYPLLSATLLGGLAVDRAHQGQKLGEFLLADALHRSLEQSTAIGSIAVIADAIDDHARALLRALRFPGAAGPTTPVLPAHGDHRRPLQSGPIISPGRVDQVAGKRRSVSTIAKHSVIVAQSGTRLRPVADRS
jgi:hypothetical protein